MENAAKAGVGFIHGSGHRTRHYFPEIVTGGVGLLDYDGDGLLDIYCVNGGSLDPVSTNAPGNRLYRNLGGWKFEDVTERAGVGAHSLYGMGCACADYDGDGDADIFVTGVGGNLLFENRGDGTFVDVTDRAGVRGTSWGTSAAFADLNGDGNLDLIIANYVEWSRDTEVNCQSRGGLPDYCSPLNYPAPAMDTLLRNRGDGTFEEVTRTAGLDKAFGNGMGVACADFDQDGKLDIFIANDAMPNQMWMNRGDGTFIDEAMIRGSAVSILGIPRAGMGVAVVDLLQRGAPDLYVTHLTGEGNGVFINTNGLFIDSASRQGPAASSLPYTGFGLVFADFDNDGHLDLYVANGRVRYGARDLDPRDPYAEPNTLMRGLGPGRFAEVQPQGGVVPALLATSRGLACGDLDNDGWMDLVVINRDGPAHVLKNVAPRGHHWILLRLTDRNGRFALGANLRVEADGNTYWRDANPHHGYCASHDPRVHVGLGRAEIVDRVTVRWPDRTLEEFGPLNADQIHGIRQGQGKPVRGFD